VARIEPLGVVAEDVRILAGDRVDDDELKRSSSPRFRS